jgi:hypothetical protein
MSENKVSPLKSFFAGGFGGVCLVTSGHPLDTIKVSAFAKLIMHFCPSTAGDNCRDQTTTHLKLPTT